MALTHGTSAVSPRRLARILRDSQAARIATVQERDGRGNLCQRTLDITDIELNVKEPREVIAMDEELERQVLHTLKMYKGSLQYVTFMVTIAVLILFLQLVF